MIDHSAMKLGRLRPGAGHKLVMLRDFLPALVFPVATSWLAQSGIGNWDMFGNDTLGDCTCASPAHVVMQLTALASAPARPTVADVLTMYEKIGGYVPGQESTDQGALIADAMTYWRNVGIAGHKIDASGSIHPQDLDALRFAIAKLGAVNIGLNLPLSAQTQEVWDRDLSAAGLAGSWGAHCVPLVDYDADGFTCITWGAPKRLTDAFLLAYGDEADAPVSPDFIGASGETRSGLDLAGLTAANAALAAA